MIFIQELKEENDETYYISTYYPIDDILMGRTGTYLKYHVHLIYFSQSANNVAWSAITCVLKHRLITDVVVISIEM